MIWRLKKIDGCVNSSIEPSNLQTSLVPSHWLHNVQICFGDMDEEYGGVRFELGNYLRAERYDKPLQVYFQVFDSGRYEFFCVSLPPSRFMSKLQIFVSPYTNPFLNLAFESYFFQQSKGYVLFLYRNQPSVIIGRNQNPWKEVVISRLGSSQTTLESALQSNTSRLDHSVHLVRRFSGGGTVYHDLGNTNYTFVMPRHEFHRSIAVNLVCRGLHELDVPAFVNERFDIMLNDGIITGKISGSAYKLGKDRAYHHGTMLIDSDLGRLKHFLTEKAPASVTGFGTDSVRSKVTKLREVSYIADHVTFCDAVMDSFQKEYGSSDPIMLSESHLNQEIVTTFAQVQKKDWIYGQTPKFTMTLRNSFEFGEMGLELQIDKGVVISVEATSPSAVFSQRVERILTGMKIYDMKLQPEQSDLEFLVDWIQSKH
jgi:lipoate-protein ligase A